MPELIPLKEFERISHDAVLWKTRRLWKNARDPDDQASAMDSIVLLLCAINNETRRDSYIRLICDDSKATLAQHKDKWATLKKALAAIEKKLQQKKTAALNKQYKELQQEILDLEEIADYPLQEKAIRRQLKDLQKRKADEIEQKKAKAAFEKKISTVADAGLPEDFGGEIYSALKYGIYEYENVYYSRGGKQGDYPISNFTMKILYHVETSDDQAWRLIAVKNVYGFEVVIYINTDDYVSLGSFKKILARRGDFIFKGTDLDLTRLSEFLQKDEIKTDFIKTLGYHSRGNFWAWANGIMPLGKENAQLDFIPIDHHGIINYGDKNYFIPACSKMFSEKDDLFVNEKKFRYVPKTQNFHFKEWAKLMNRAYGSKSIPAILFFIGSLFRDIAIKQKQRYPLLNLFGPPGAGKGQMAESIMAMFGERQDQIMLGGASTVVGFMRKFAQFRNSIVWLDEYKNNLPVKFIESFKNIYDGKGYERGQKTNDFSTESTPIHSSCILSGQDMPTQEPALYMRLICVSFEEGKFSEQQREAFQQLKNDYESYGLSFITASLFQYREIIKEKFKDSLELIFKQTVKEVANVEVDDRMIFNISILLTFMHLLYDHVQFPWTYKEAKTWLIANMMHQHAVLAGNNDVAKFWGTVESLFYLGEIHIERDFKLQDGKLYLRLMQVHPIYADSLTRRRDPNILSKSTLEYYLTLDKTVYLAHERKRFEDGSNNWCYVFKYSALKIDMIKVIPGGMSAVQLEEELQRKYREMGVADSVPIPETSTPDVPPTNSQHQQSLNFSNSPPASESTADDLPF